MPLKANIGLSKKVGLPDYGSLGANCQLELELDASLIGDAEAFHEKIQRLYALANQAVVDQLARQATAPSNNGNGNGHAKPGNGRNGNGAHTNGNGNGRTNGDVDNSPASNKQIKYLLDIARQRHRMDLAQTAEFCREQVGINDVYQLTKSQASVVIDRLNQKNGQTNGRR
jgi:hypothetical protein